MKTKIVCLIAVFAFSVFSLQAAERSADFDSGYQSGYYQGFKEGYNRGYSGVPDASVPAVKAPQASEKYQQGLQAGLTHGFQTGYFKGINDRRKDEKGVEYQKGYDIGYKDGFSGAGYNAPAGDTIVEENTTGYHEGYFDGVRDKATAP